MAGKAYKIPDGSIEALKWIGLVLMTGDHVDKYLFSATLPVLFEAGRLCLPIFVFVLAYNLARPGALQKGVHLRTMKRLAITGIIASVPYIGLGGLLAGWWPLNVLFTLLVLTASIYLLDRNGRYDKSMAWLLVLVGGGLVESKYPGVIGGIAVWHFFRNPASMPLIIAILSCALLWLINHNFWSLTAIPLILVLSRFDLPVKRLQWVFYAYYPIHLSAIWLIKIQMTKAGYLFFY
jgi:hypothetical protein